MVETRKISGHTKTRRGTPAPAGTYTDKTGTVVESGGKFGRTTTAGHAQYVIIYGKGKKRVSETKHCSEADIESYKAKLIKAGY